MAEEGSHVSSGVSTGGIVLGPGALDPRAAAYLEEQTRLAKLQSDNLIEQNAFEVSHLRWRKFSDRMSGALQTMLALVALLIVVGLAMAIWNAANDRGLVVEAFSVPPDLAAKGLTGEVIATKVLDRLAALQAQTGSMRTSQSYANNWGDDIKVQIPNTGVSIGEFNRALHQWLGHATHISGEVYRTPSGVALSARVGGDSTPVFKGSEADIDALIDKAADSIYRSTQPYRYSSWLDTEGRAAESSAVLQSIIDTTTDARERAWAYNGMAHNTIETGAVEPANVFLRKAIASDPSLFLPQANLAGGEQYLGRDEKALAVSRFALQTGLRGDPTMAPAALTQNVLVLRVSIAQLTGDYASGADVARQLQAAGDAETAHEAETMFCGLLHDLACFRAAAASLSMPTDDTTRLSRVGVLQEARAGLGQWDAVAKAAPSFHDGLSKNAFMGGVEYQSDVPLRAAAAAHLGNTKLAQALIDRTPADCVRCLRVRGQIAAAEHDWNGAAYWFARASRISPSIPFADSDWGEMLLRKGDFDGAIAKFESANKKGPHFADPLEMWGEALIAKNRSDLALAKFEEANKYAPNWGRLHLKWGEALLWSGDKAGAQQQFAIAHSLDLAPRKQSELIQVSHG
jgi:tetratricopeptide (TPR) repeat protein